jgi:ATP/ADP translocase
MTYIPLDRDGKTKGKAAIDVLGARLGKSGTKLLPRIGFYRMLYLAVHIDS